MPAPARWVMLSFELSRKRHFRRTILGYLKDPTAKVVPSPVLFYIVLYSRSLAAGNHSLCAKLHDNRSGGCKHIVASLLSSSHINHGMFLFFGVCLVAISNGIFFLYLPRTIGSIYLGNIGKASLYVVQSLALPRLHPRAFRKWLQSLPTCVHSP